MEVRLTLPFLRFRLQWLLVSPGCVPVLSSSCLLNSVWWALQVLCHSRPQLSPPSGPSHTHGLPFLRGRCHRHGTLSLLQAAGKQVLEHH